MSFLAQLQARVTAQPHAPALEDGALTWSYAELWAAAGGVTRALVAQGVLPGDVVAVEAPRSAGWVAQVLGAWMAGAAWLPLDPAWPDARRAELITRAGAHPPLRALPEPADPEPHRFPGPQALAWVIATSGSTGAPKLVEVTHRGLVPMLEAQIAAFQLGPGDRGYWMLAPVFDASVSDVGTVLLAGATLVVGGEVEVASLPATWARLAITHVDLPPALMAALDPEALPDDLRVVIFGGEPSPPARVRRWARGRRLVQAYGPTEATVCTHLAVVAPEAWARPTIGQPIAGMRHRVVEGELWLGGPGLALGYRGQPALTAERFVVQDGLRWYRTGDHVRDEAGELVFMGRVDRQLKLAGRLIAPEEVEAALAAHPGVERAAVWAEGLRLLARVEGAPAPGLTAHLQARLPGWMVPAEVRVGPLPLLPSGKVDHAALRVQAAAPAPHTVEAWQARLAQALLREVGPDESFFEAGADSMAVLELVAGAEAEGLRLDVATLHRHPTARALAAWSRAAPAPTGVTLGELEARLPAFTWGAGPPPSEARPRTIFMTGATGFLGVHVLAALAGHRRSSPCDPQREHVWSYATDERRSRSGRSTENEPAQPVGDFSDGLLGGRVEVVALARDPAQASLRLREAAASYALSVAEPRWVAGDVGRPELGMTPEDYEAIATTAERVLHCAGQLSLTASLEQLWPANVLGTHHALELAHHRRRKAFIHAGSLVVLVSSRERRGPLGEEALPVDARLVGAYAQSKALAERLVMQVTVPAANVRLGLLVGSRHAHLGAPQDWLSRAVRAFAHRFEGVADEAAFDMTPVDHAAEVLARLVLRAEPPEGTFHVAAEAPVTAARLRAALPGPASGGSASVARLAAPGAGEPSPFDLFLSTGVRFECARTEAATGLAAPRVDDAELATYVARILDDARG
ncbi:MAG: AMP-binding protein [Myxococcales bacterium]|nr:AMP-binding protein [Myxococcales bacterium]